VDPDVKIRWSGFDCYKKVAGVDSYYDGASNTDKALALECLEDGRAITICDSLKWAGVVRESGIYQHSTN